jgi:hypothetical protein
MKPSATMVILLVPTIGTAATQEQALACLQFINLTGCFSPRTTQMAGPFTTFLEAADAVGLLGVNQATTSIWVESKYRADAEGAISLFDDLSREVALALFSDGSPNGI